MLVWIVELNEKEAGDGPFFKKNEKKKKKEKMI